MRPEEATAHAASDRRTQLFRLAEYAFAALAVFSTTRGPIYRLGQQLDDPSDVVNNFAATFSWFILIYATSLALLVHRWKRRPTLRWLFICLFSYHSMLLLSTAWSIWRGQTFYQAVALAGTSCLGVYLGTRFTIFEVTAVVWVATHVGLLLSLFAIQRHWPDARDINAHWVGMYLNRNSFAPILVLGMFSSLALIAVWPPGISRRARTVLGVGLAAWAAIDLAALSQTRSATSSFAAAAGVAVVVLVLLVRAVARPSARPRTLTWSVLGIGIVVSTALNFSRPWLARRAKRDLTFSGRTIIWAEDRVQIMRRPFQGWGWLGAWKDQTFLDRLASRGQPVFEAHSGYYEVLLGTGIVGFAVFAALLFVIVFGVLDAAFRRRDAPSLVLVAFVTFALVLNISETFDTAHQIPWLLLITCGCLALGRDETPDEPTVGSSVDEIE